MRPRRRIGRVVAAVALICAGALAVPAVRIPILQAAGHALVADEPVSRADVIVIAVDAGRSGALEAADLVREGVASRVAFFADVPSAADVAFAARGLPDDEVERLTRDLHVLGVQQVEQIPERVTGTEEQGEVLPRWLARQRIGSAIVVTMADHSRRVRRVLHRTMDGYPARVSVRATRYSDFQPATWWYSRTGVRTWAEEMQKLLLDVARHPIS